VLKHDDASCKALFLLVLFYYFPFLSFYQKKKIIGIFFYKANMVSFYFHDSFENMVSFYFHDFFEIVKHSEYTSHKKNIHIYTNYFIKYVMSPLKKKCKV